MYNATRATVSRNVAHFTREIAHAQFNVKHDIMNNKRADAVLSCAMRANDVAHPTFASARTLRNEKRERARLDFMRECDTLLRDALRA